MAAPGSSSAAPHLNGHAATEAEKPVAAKENGQYEGKASKAPEDGERRSFLRDERRDRDRDSFESPSRAGSPELELSGREDDRHAARKSEAGDTPGLSVVRHAASHHMGMKDDRADGSLRRTKSSLTKKLNDIKAEAENGNDDDTSPDGRFIRYSGESEKLLGEGAYKKVWLACDTLEGREVAWNLINIRNLPKREKHRIVDEIRLLKSLGKNDHIIEFVSTWTKRETGEVIFITEIMPSGSLKDFINRVRVIKYKVIKKWCSNILNGLIFLHHHDPPIIHRDLKCDNLFYDGSHRRGGKIVIGDMGLSTYMLGPKPGSVLGTPQFMAPELYEDQGYDERIDVYSFGMCVLEMVSKKPPYDGLNVAQIYKRVTAGEKPPLLHKVKNAVCREFISICLGPPNQRPTARELVENDFLVTQKTQDDTADSDHPRRMVVPDDEVAELVDDEDVYTGISQSKAIESAPSAAEDDEKVHEIPTGETMQSRIDEATVEDEGDSDDDGVSHSQSEDGKIVWNDSQKRQPRKALLEMQDAGSGEDADEQDADAHEIGNGASEDLDERPAVLPLESPGSGAELRVDSRDASIVIQPGEADSSIKTVEIDVPDADIQLEFPMDLRTDTVESIAEEMLQAFRQMQLEVNYSKERIVALIQESLDRQGTRTELSSDVGGDETKSS